MKQCDLKRENKNWKKIQKMKMTVFQNLWRKTMVQMLTMKIWKRDEQSPIKCPKTKVCNLKERRNNEIPGSNIGKSLKKLKLDERVKFGKYVQKLKDMVVNILVSICVSKKE